MFAFLFFLLLFALYSLFFVPNLLKLYLILEFIFVIVLSIMLIYSSLFFTLSLQMLVLFMLGLLAIETAIGLSLLLKFYRFRFSSKKYFLRE